MFHFAVLGVKIHPSMYVHQIFCQCQVKFRKLGLKNNCLIIVYIILVNISIYNKIELEYLYIGL